MDFGNFNFGTKSNGSSNSSSNGVLNLQKNQSLDLTKEAPSLKRCILGAGWDVSEGNETYDLDIAAFLLGENGRVNDVRTDVVYFRQMVQRGIRLEGDNRTGAGEGDDERIDVNLNDIDANVKEIVFFIVIYEADKKRQTFGMVRNSFVRLLDADDREREVLRYELKDNYSSDTAITVASLKRANNGWTFTAIGEGSIGDLNTLLSRYQ